MPDLIITPNRGTANNPTINFVGLSAGNNLTPSASSISLQVLPTGQLAFNGSTGSLFSITDSLTGSLMAVSDQSGLPIFQVFSNNAVVAGPYNTNTFVVSGTNVGIRTNAPSATLTISGTLSASQAVWVNNNFNVDSSGNVTAISYTSTSSKTGKTNIRPLSALIADPLSTTQLLSAVVYDSLLDSSTNQIGFIAEDVLTALPQVVTVYNDTVVGIDYTRITAVLVEAIKEQQIQINNQNILIAQLSAKLT